MQIVLTKVRTAALLPLRIIQAKLLRDLEARAGIEPAHKGFAVLVIQSKLLTNMGISVGRCALKRPDFALFCLLLAAKWQPSCFR